jgi:hypothetical protein
MDYAIEVLKKEKMRYSTCGDYYQIADTLSKFDICEQVNPDYEFLIMIHELVEEYLTRKRGITEESIMDFDLKFEDERDQGLHSEWAEPGYDIRSPYRKEHIFAELIERLIANELGVDWIEYEEKLIS